MQAPASCKVYTPDDLALAMAEALGHRPGDLWLDPCCGTGAFCRAISHLYPNADLTAVDLDRRASKSVDVRTVISGVDFLRWSRETTTRFSKIIANPPYIAIRRLPTALRKSAVACKELSGFPVTENANYWYVFVLQCVVLLKPGGSMCAVLPAAWDYANYAAGLRNRIGTLFKEVDVHRCEQPLFDDVRDGSVVIVAQGRGDLQDRQRRFEYTDRMALVQGLGKRGAKQAACMRIDQSKSGVRGERRFGDLFELRIGAVAGDSRYFVLSEQQRIRFGLPKRCLVPVVSRATHITKSELGRKSWNELLRSGERVWLFRPHQGSGRRGPIRKYLLRSESSGGCRRSAYKVRTRTPWYQTRMPRSPDGFVSGMAGVGPFISWKQMRRLTATNTLYVVRCRSGDVHASRFAWSLAMMSSTVRQQLASRARIYADGLSKLEPRDFQDLLLPVPPRRAGARAVYRKVVRLLLAGEQVSASRVADDWLKVCDTAKHCSKKLVDVIGHRRVV